MTDIPTFHILRRVAPFMNASEKLAQMGPQLFDLSFDCAAGALTQER